MSQDFLDRQYTIVYLWDIYSEAICNSIISVFLYLPGAGKPSLHMNHGIMDNFLPICDFKTSIYCSGPGIWTSLHLRTCNSEVLLFSFLAHGNSALSLSFYLLSFFLLVYLSLLWFSLSPVTFPFLCIFRLISLFLFAHCKL